MKTELIILILGVFTFFLLKFIFWYLQKRKIEFFLYNNGYVAENPKTKKLIYPKVKFDKKYVKIKNCVKKSSEQIFNEKKLWEQSFHKEMNNKKISDVKVIGSEINLALI